LSSDIVTKLRDDTRHVLWSQDRVRLYAADYIERLEAVVRAADKVIERINENNENEDVRHAAYLSGLWHRTGAFKEARARVNLPAPPDRSVNPATLTLQNQPQAVDASSQAALDNSKKEASDGKET
jgi:hypothetical protein